MPVDRVVDTFVVVVDTTGTDYGDLVLQAELNLGLQAPNFSRFSPVGNQTVFQSRQAEADQLSVEGPRLVFRGARWFGPKLEETAQALEYIAQVLGVKAVASGVNPTFKVTCKDPALFLTQLTLGEQFVRAFGAEIQLGMFQFRVPRTRGHCMYTARAVSITPFQLMVDTNWHQEEDGMKQAAERLRGWTQWCDKLTQEWKTFLQEA